MKVADAADSVLDAIRDLDGELAGLNQMEPPGWQLMTPEQKMAHLDALKQELGKTQQVTQDLQVSTDQREKSLQDLQGLGVEPQVTDPSMIQSKRNIFHLIKQSQMEMAAPVQQSPQLPQNPTESVDPDQNGQSNVSEVRSLLDGFVQQAMATGSDESEAKTSAIDSAFQYIVTKFTNPNQKTSDPMASNVEGDSQQTVRDAVNNYFSTNDEAAKDLAASVLARTIFPHDDSADGEEISAIPQKVKVHVSSIIDETNSAIHKMADSDATKTTKFNLKTAQHKSLENTFMFGPNNVRDEFTGQLINEWHLVERNKGWGLRLTDEYALNWEKVWRENIMDKYDPAYIERRFEVDKNVPPTNDIYLQPGQTRRITPPEYGNTESRLEAERTTLNKDRGYSPSEKGEVFNWKKAQVSPNPVSRNDPFKAAPIPQQMHLCVSCRNPLPMSNGMPAPKCPSCGAMQNGQAVPGEVRLGPAPAKAASVDEILAHGGIIFDSVNGKFIVAGDKKKKKFDTYYEAEEFKMQEKQQTKPQMQQPKPKVKATLTPQQAQRRREVTDHADKLGIDG